MAIIKRGIMGGLSGKIGNVVGSSWKGRAILKSLPISVANPKTEGQVSQRTKFKAVSQILSVILTSVVRVMYNPTAGNISGANQFARQNKQMFDGIGTFLPENAYMGAGSLPSEIVESVEQNAGSDDITVSWSLLVPTGSIRELDKVVIWAFDPASGRVWSSFANVMRDDLNMSLTPFKSGSDLAEEVQVYVFLGFVSPDGRVTSVKQLAQHKTISWTPVV